MVEVMKIMGAPSKGPVPHSVPLTLQQATANLGLHWRFLALTGKPGSVSCEVTAPFSWVLVRTGFVCALQESVSPVLWKFYNHVPLAFKVIFPGGSQSLCWIPRLGIHQVVLQFVGHLPHSSVVGLW